MLGIQELAVFTTLVFIEVILGIDNIVVLAIVVDKLPEHKKRFARALGLSLAYILRVLFVLLALSIKHTDYTMSVFSLSIAVPSLLFGVGGLFLIGKGLSEIYGMLKPSLSNLNQSASLLTVILQITFIDLVFSFDSVLTAVALTSNRLIIISAITIAILSMYFASGIVSTLIQKFKRLKLLALLFVVLVGFYLLLEAFHLAFDRTYLFAMISFCIIYEMTGYFVLSRQNK